MPYSDPNTPDLARTGDDLLARIDELTVGRVPEGCKDGWRCLLMACGREIGRLRAELRGIAARIEDHERKRSC